MENNDILLADRVEHLMIEEIAGCLSRNDYQLPQQQELADRYDVSLRTIRTVVDRLKVRNVIRSIKGKGMFIVAPAKQTGNVLVVADRLEHPYTSMVVSTVSNVLLPQGLTPVIVGSSDLERVSSNVQGVLLVACDDIPLVESFLARTKLPYCAINDIFDLHFSQPVHHQTVRSNSYLWTFVLTEMLLRNGKEKIFLFTSMTVLASGQDKIRGYRDALSHYGRDYDEQYVINVIKDNDPAVDDFCNAARTVIERESRRYPGRIGYADISGTMTYPQSMFYHRIIEGLANAPDVAVAEFAESPKAFMTKMQVTASLTRIIGRAVDIIMSRAEPFSICETLDDFRIRVNESGIWQQYDYREYLAKCKQQLTTSNNKQ